MHKLLIVLLIIITVSLLSHAQIETLGSMNIKNHSNVHPNTIIDPLFHGQRIMNYAPVNTNTIIDPVFYSPSN